jgi:hypothetical protein
MARECKGSARMGQMSEAGPVPVAHKEVCAICSHGWEDFECYRDFSPTLIRHNKKGRPPVVHD